MNPHACSAASDHRRLRRALQEKTRADFDALLGDSSLYMPDDAALSSWLLLSELHGLPDEPNRRPTTARLKAYLAALDTQAIQVLAGLKEYPTGALALEHAEAHAELVAGLPSVGEVLASWPEAFAELAQAWIGLARSGLLTRDDLSVAANIAACSEDLGRVLNEVADLSIVALNEEREGDRGAALDADRLGEIAQLLIDVHAGAGFLGIRVPTGPDYDRLRADFVTDLKAALQEDGPPDQDLLGEIAQLLVRDALCFDELGLSYERFAELAKLPIVDDPAPPAVAIVRRGSAAIGRRRTFLAPSATSPSIVPARGDGQGGMGIADILRAAAANYQDERGKMAIEADGRARAQAAKAARLRAARQEHDLELAQAICTELLRQLPQLMREAARANALFITVASMTEGLGRFLVDRSTDGRLPGSVFVRIGNLEDRNAAGVFAGCHRAELKELHIDRCGGSNTHGWWEETLLADMPDRWTKWPHIESRNYRGLHALGEPTVRFKSARTGGGKAELLVFASDGACLTGAPGLIYQALRTAGFPVEVVHYPFGLVSSFDSKRHKDVPPEQHFRCDASIRSCTVHIMMRIERILQDLESIERAANSLRLASGTGIAPAARG